MPSSTIRSLPCTVSALALLAALCTATSSGSSWRSRLYPENWTSAQMDAQGRFLHDFSYAGYRNGEVPLPSEHSSLPVIEVEADRTGKADTTAAIQSAVETAKRAHGGVVHLPAGLYRCDGMLVVDAPGIILRGDGPRNTRLFFTKVKDMSGKSHVTFRGALRRGPDIPLAGDAGNRSFVVKVNDATDLQVGDEISVGWVITDAFVAQHNMADIWKRFNGKWRPFFRRTVSGLDLTTAPHEVKLDIPLRYAALIRDAASVRKETGYLTGCGIERLALSNAADPRAAWSENRVHVLRLECVSDCWIRKIESFSSPLPAAKGYHLQNCGILILDSKRVTVADCRFKLAQNRGGGGCGYLFEVSRSNEILIRDCTAVKGRHNFIQNWDFGTTGCVWLRCMSRGSRAFKGRLDPMGWPAFCDYHHSLAMACLIDQCTLNDGWYGGNRRHWSTGAGLTATQSVYWNTRGGGRILSWQYGWGYIIGTDGIKLKTALSHWSADGSEPEDYVEGAGKGAFLVPPSLYEDQLRRRLGSGGPDAGFR